MPTPEQRVVRLDRGLRAEGLQPLDLGERGALRRLFGEQGDLPARDRRLVCAVLARMMDARLTGADV